jgi:hypothetical protein
VGAATKSLANLCSAAALDLVDASRLFDDRFAQQVEGPNKVRSGR